MQHHLRARSRAAGLDEAQVARRDARLERQLELAETPAQPPFPEHLPDGRQACRGSAHDADRSQRPVGGHYLRGHGLAPLRQAPSARQRSKEETMVAAQLVERYLDTWNEKD